jgi:hypothetical protein
MTTNEIMEMAEARNANWFLTEGGTVRLNVDYFKYPVCPAAAAFKTSTAAARQAAGKKCEIGIVAQMNRMIATSDNDLSNPSYDPELRERMERNCKKQFHIDFA